MISVRYRRVCGALLLVCLLTLGACVHRATLSGTSWKLRQLTLAGSTQQLVPTAPVTLQFQQSGATYVGSSGCNYYSGSYTVSGDQLHLQFTGVTARACAGPIMSQEVSYLKALDNVHTFEMNGQMLTLKGDSDRPVLVFEAT